MLQNDLELTYIVIYTFWACVPSFYGVVVISMVDEEDPARSQAFLEIHESSPKNDIHTNNLIMESPNNFIGNILCMPFIGEKKRTTDLI